MRTSEAADTTTPLLLLIRLTQAVDVLATVPAGSTDDKLVWERVVGPIHAEAQEYLLANARDTYTGIEEEERMNKRPKVIWLVGDSEGTGWNAYSSRARAEKEDLWTTWL